VKPRTKKQPAPAAPVQPVHRKTKSLRQPIQPTDTIRKTKHPAPVQSVQPVKKHKVATRPTAPEPPVQKPPVY
jgi:hypothetical protein